VHAFIDESFGNIGHERVYVVAAACIESRDLEFSRQALRDLNPSDSKLHWHRERPQARRALLRAMADLPSAYFTVTRISVDERPERQRRLCLRTLISELKGSGLGRAVLESRGIAGDRRDRAALDWQARTGPSPISIHHSLGIDEPLVWSADFVCGATWAQFNGNDSYVSILEKMNITNLEASGN